MSNIIVGFIVFVIVCVALYFSFKGKGSDCSSCNESCSSKNCGYEKED